jgi:hypothetical protein
MSKISLASRQILAVVEMSKWFFGSRVTPSVDLNEILQYLEDQIELSDHHEMTDKTLPLVSVHKEVHQGGYEVGWRREAAAMCSPR